MAHTTRFGNDIRHVGSKIRRLERHIIKSFGDMNTTVPNLNRQKSAKVTYVLWRRTIVYIKLE